jgi:hypothetical protein
MYCRRLPAQTILMSSFETMAPGSEHGKRSGRQVNARGAKNPDSWERSRSAIGDRHGGFKDYPQDGESAYQQEARRNAWASFVIPLDRGEDPEGGMKQANFVRQTEKSSGKRPTAANKRDYHASYDQILRQRFGKGVKRDRSRIVGVFRRPDKTNGFLEESSINIRTRTDNPLADRGVSK